MERGRELDTETSRKFDSRFGLCRHGSQWPRHCGKDEHTSQHMGMTVEFVSSAPRTPSLLHTQLASNRAENFELRSRHLFLQLPPSISLHGSLPSRTRDQ